jgi:hypothetical protein
MILKDCSFPSSPNFFLFLDYHFRPLNEDLIDCGGKKGEEERKRGLEGTG